MRRAGQVWALAAVALVLSCGGSTNTSGSGGSGGSTGGNGGSTGGTGAVGTTGGSGNVAGNTGGAGGCVTTTCGPDGSSCCNPKEMCATGMTSCTCGSDYTWMCITEGGGSGGTGGCVDVGCGPHGSQCCFPGEGCGTAAGGGPGYSCTCTGALTWDCSGATGGSGGMAGCGGAGGCGPGLTCCAGACVNTQNDPYNCGGCFNTCAANPPFCAGICQPPPCYLGNAPPPGYFCCGQNACAKGQLCCDVQGPGPSSGPSCYTPTAAQPTCPVGCPTCQ